MVVDQLRWGLIPDRRDVDGNERKEWMEVGDVEGWLMDWGFVVESKGEWGMEGERLVPQLSIENVRLSTKAPIVPYGTVWNPIAGSEEGEVDAKSLLEVCFNPLSMASHGVYSSSQVCLSSGASLSRGMHTGQGDHTRSYLNIDHFVECLMQHSICLGRTAGFRRKEVEDVLNECVIKI